jgi:hypothetical protein
MIDKQMEYDDFVTDESLTDRRKSIY